MKSSERDSINKSVQHLCVCVCVRGVDGWTDLATIYIVQIVNISMPGVLYMIRGRIKSLFHDRRVNRQMWGINELGRWRFTCVAGERTNVNVTVETNCWLCQTGIKTSERYSKGEILCVVFMFIRCLQRTWAEMSYCHEKDWNLRH